MKEELIHLTFQVNESHQLLRDAIRQYGISKKALTSIKYEGGKITVNGAEKTVRHKLNVGDTIKITFPPEKKSAGLIPQQVEFPILMEDEHLLILTKVAGISTIPSREHPTGTMANFIAGYMEKSGLSSTVHIVTRLDKDTSGIICVAKHRHAHHLLSKMQKSGQISRTYEAIVHGHIQQGEFVIDAPIGRKNGSIIERIIDSHGKQAKTSVQVLSHFEEHRVKLTHVRLQLHTGRTHQIRVHMMSIGHPLIGDDLYGGNLQLIQRQALHARELKLIHPFTNENIHLIAPFPEDMNPLISH